MAIVQTICTSFLRELALGQHNFDAAGNIFKIALFINGATLDENTVAYDPGGDPGQIGYEVVGTGYGAGGVSIASVTPVAIGDVIVFDFADATWGPGASFTARAALLYNDTLPNKAAVGVWDFGSDQVVTAGNFNIVMPIADAVNAILRLND